MKNVIIILMLVLASCGAPVETSRPIKQQCDIVITDINVCKYSQVRGMTTFCKVPVVVDNGTSGYYYKRYGKLHVGDVIKQDLVFYFRYTNGGTEVCCITDIDVKKFETK